ncbi:hypothetical protein Zmor_019101 [Zophobas morio]|uniref:Uncharacterized protein n=1 Tax=Zophobas morio TaxID=2755281 RepID=A0AA38M0T0_9CUCU|nr:hypothetical protein Zmor_019101 [Zophobas morio]
MRIIIVALAILFAKVYAVPQACIYKDSNCNTLIVCVPIGYCRANVKFTDKGNKVQYEKFLQSDCSGTALNNPLNIPYDSCFPLDPTSSLYTFASKAILFTNFGGPISLGILMSVLCF